MNYLSTAHSLQAGALIARRFRLLRPLSQGGMGSVWVAHHENLGIEVAVKFVEVKEEGREEAFRRFEREATVIARLKSPHVVQILDYGLDEAQRPYLAMELLTGDSLRERVERRGPLALSEVVKVVKQVCHALAKAHRAGIIHRDIKPANIFLCDDEDSGGFTAKVLDFGVAKMVRGSPGEDAQDHAETAAGALVGTPLYMSPEQALGDVAIDGRSDFYSLGMAAYFALVGHIPFEEPGKKMGLGELLVAVTTKAMPPPSIYLPQLPPAVDAWFACALAKAPDQRWSNARDMADALAFATNHSTLDLSAAYGAMDASAGSLALSRDDLGESNPELRARPRGSYDPGAPMVPSRPPLPSASRGLLVGLALGAGLLVAGAAFFALRRSSPTAAGASPASATASSVVSLPSSPVAAPLSSSPVAAVTSEPAAGASAEAPAPPVHRDAPRVAQPEPRRWIPRTREPARPSTVATTRSTTPPPAPTPAPTPRKPGNTLDERQ